MQETIEIDAGRSEFIIRFEGEEHKVGVTSSYNRSQGFYDPLFYLDEQKFSTLKEFKEQAVLNKRIFSFIAVKD